MSLIFVVAANCRSLQRRLRAAAGLRRPRRNLSPATFPNALPSTRGKRDRCGTPDTPLTPLEQGAWEAGPARLSAPKTRRLSEDGRISSPNSLQSFLSVSLRAATADPAISAKAPSGVEIAPGAAFRPVHCRLRHRKMSGKKNHSRKIPSFTSLITPWLLQQHSLFETQQPHPLFIFIYLFCTPCCLDHLLPDPLHLHNPPPLQPHPPLHPLSNVSTA